MYWFAGTGTNQQTSTVKLEVLWNSLKRSMVTKGLALNLSHNSKQFINLWHLWGSIYECSESVFQMYYKEKF